MGFETPRRVLKLAFDDPELDGLEVKVRSVSLDRYLGFADFGRLAELRTRAMTSDDRALVARMFDEFADALVEWNLTEDGEPVPATRQGVRDQDAEFMTTVVLAWITALIGVSAPLDSSSTGGPPSEALELSIPMEPLSALPESTSVPA